MLGLAETAVDVYDVLAEVVGVGDGVVSVDFVVPPERGPCARRWRGVGFNVQHPDGL